uniref:Uncharacterized protein n=1 Tax=Equus caballus TaxID=9796 RepID=A0A3Q2H540_HORSE
TSLHLGISGLWGLLRCLSMSVSLPSPSLNPPPLLFPSLLLSEAVTAQKQKTKLAKQAFYLICSLLDCVQREKATVR